MVTDTYVYDAWGNMVSKSGSTLQPFKYIGEYGYYAHFQDDDVMPYTVTSSTTSGTVLSFIQTGVRTYFPRLGRYMQVDPIKDGLNWLEYCGDNPVNAMDPTGLLTTQVNYGCASEVMVCFRYFKQASRDDTRLHAFLLIDRKPIGYDLDGVGQI